MFLGTLGVILLVLALGIGANRQGGGVRRPAGRQIVDERLATGEISTAQHRDMLAVLGEERSRVTGRWAPWVVAGLGVLLLVGSGVLVARGGDGWWAGHWSVMDGHMGWGRDGTTSAAAPAAGAEEFTVEAGDLWFRPDTVEIEAGQTVNLTVDNTGRAFHDLTVAELDLRVDVEAGDATTTAVTVDTPGTYDFFCSVPGHEVAGMRGQLVVQ